MERRDILRGGFAGMALAAMPTQLLGAQTAGMSDMEVLRLALTLHPGHYRYNTPAQIDTGLEALGAAYDSVSDLQTKFVSLSRFLGSIQCGHTYCNFFNQSDAVKADLFDRPTRLPFHFVWLDDRMIVTADKSGTDMITAGSEIVSIDGRPVANYLSELMPYARADGGNDAKRRSLLGVTDDSIYEYFDIFQGLLMPPGNGRFALQFVTPAGEGKSVEFAAIKRNEGPARAKDEAMFQSEMRDDGVMLLSMPSWVIFRTSWDWQGWLNDKLAEASAAKGLIVDIRGNEGGSSDPGNQILAALASEGLVLDQYKPRVRYRRSPEALEPYIKTFMPEARELGLQGVEVGEGFYGYPDFVPAPRIEATSQIADTPTAILMDSANSSATFEFARNAKQFELAKLFGERSGGNLRGTNGTYYFFVTLPESGIEFDLPLIGEFPVKPQPKRGIDPDVSVCRRPEDIAVGRDPALEAAAAWIANG